MFLGGCDVDSFFLKEMQLPTNKRGASYTKLALSAALVASNSGQLDPPLP